MRTAALALTALALAVSLGACESSQEKNTEIEKADAREAALAAKRRALAQRGQSITRPSAAVRVTDTSLVPGSNGEAAVVVSLKNTSGRSLRELPIEVTVRGARGATLYTNTTPGLAPPLVSVPFLAAHATSTWVDDQVPVPRSPKIVDAKVGEGERVDEAPPSLAVVGAHLAEGGVEGSLVNHSHVTEREVVIYAVARRAGALVAAGSAVVAPAEAGASQHFLALLIGDANGAQLEVTAAPTSPA